MQKNKIGSSPIYVSPFTLGCMSLDVNQRQAQEMIERAIDAGINHFDTADLYQFGQNEQMLGHLLSSRREDVIITTKVGNHFDPVQKNWVWNPSKQYINKAVEASLKRLQTDYIDLYLLHGGTLDDPFDDIIDTFERLKSTGIIRAYGISSIRPNVIRKYVEQSNIDAVMMQYNLLDRRPEELLDYLHEHRISVFARGPLAKGILTNQASSQIEKKATQGYLTYKQSEVKQIIQQLQQWGEPLEKLAFQYVLQHPAVTSAVFGARTLEQLQQNIQQTRSYTNMEQTRYRQIQSLTKELTYTLHR